MKIDIHDQFGQASKKKNIIKPVTALVSILSIIAVCLTIITIFFWEDYKIISRFYIANWAHNYGYLMPMNRKSPAEALLLSPVRFLKSLHINNLPRLKIDIKFKHYNKIKDKRKEAFKVGILTQQSSDYVPAKIRFQNNTIKAKLRLKGDWLDHLIGKKWSFRIHLKGENTLFGMKKFSIQHPKTRGFHGEILFFETLKKFNVLTPRYIFVNVDLNGEDLGIMALEESFTKLLLENNKQREGIILKFDESLYWKSLINSEKGEFMPAFDNYKTQRIDIFNMKKTYNSPIMSKQLAFATGLLRGFQNKRFSPSHVFDSKTMGSFLAVCEFWGSWHAIRWHNLRFYFNPFTQKLEPIAFDASIYDRNNIIDGHGLLTNLKQEIMVDILKDPQIYKEYRTALLKLKKMIEKEEFIEYLMSIEKKYLTMLGMEFFLLWGYDLDELPVRIDKLLEYSRKDMLRIGEEFRPENQIKEDFPAIIHSTITGSGPDKILEFANLVPFPLEIQSIQLIDKTNNKTIQPFKPLRSISYPLYLEATELSGLPSKLSIRYALPVKHDEYRLLVKSSLIGNTKVYENVPSQYFPIFENTPHPILKIEQLLKQFPFLKLSPDHRELIVRKGTWEVNKTIRPPKGFRLKIGPGVILRFSQGAGIILSGAADFEGSIDAPIRLLPKLTKLKKPNWQGILVMSSNQKSRLSHVMIENTNWTENHGWTLTGGVTFYKATVDINNSCFSNNISEDALNIVNSSFTIKNTCFINTTSDAFDSDFSNGTVENSRFVNIGKNSGGDAIDISGAKVKVSDTTFINVADKGLSVGERSNMEVNNVSIENSSYGIACKDSSKIHLKNSSFNNINNAALIAYSKKPEFGGGTIISEKSRFNNVKIKAKVQTNSSIIIDNIESKPTNFDVKVL